MAYLDPWGTGNGIFGHWTEDGQGQPAYRYTIDQDRDPRAAHFTTLGPSRDQWHQVGNDHLTATAHVAGHVQVYDWSRGGKLLNRHDPARGRMAGGFCWVRWQGRTFATRWADIPPGGEQERIFGLNYFEKITRWQGLCLTERIEAAPEDGPCLRHRVTLRNESDAPEEVLVVPYWEASMHQLTVAALNPPWLARLCTRIRERKNRRFRLTTRWSAALRMLVAEYAYQGRAPGPECAAPMDYHPHAVFLALVHGPASALTGHCGDGAAFFGSDGQPDLEALSDGAVLDRAPGDCGHGVLALRLASSLAPGDEVAFTCAYGTAPADELPGLVEALRATPGDIAAPAATCRFEGGPPWLGRELAWHGAYLQGGTFRHDHFDACFVDQGSAYSYLHGASGAPRDYALFILPMVYLRPDLARDMLRCLFRTQKPSGKFPYAHVGQGLLRGYGVHSFSSDLDLFVLWATAEYLGATRDFAFLEEQVPYYSKVRGRGQAGTVLEHLQASFRHLAETVGTGPNGMLRARTGDWNDVFMAFSPLPPLTVLRGESSLNAGLAALALPALGSLLKGRNRDFADALEAFGAAQAKALEPLWAGAWLARGHLGFLGKVLGRDRIFLDTQAFPVLAGLWDRERRAALFDAIEARCARPQRVGANALVPPMKGPFLQQGSDTNGGVWAAIDALVAWAWSLHDPRSAWAFFLSTTLAARAETYPDIWYGVWSGPDAYNAHYHARPGETFSHNFTPMTNFPVMNMNRHSGPLLDVIKFAGFGWDGEGIRITPRLPELPWRLELALMGAAYTARTAEGYYRPQASGPVAFAVMPPPEIAAPRLVVDGEPVPWECEPSGALRFSVEAAAGRTIAWRIDAAG